MSGSRMMEGKRANEPSTQQARTAYRRATSCFRGDSITLSSQNTALSITDVELSSDAKRRQATPSGCCCCCCGCGCGGPSHHQQNENKKAVEMERETQVVEPLSETRAAAEPNNRSLSSSSRPRSLIRVDERSKMSQTPSSLIFFITGDCNAHDSKMKASPRDTAKKDCRSQR